MVWNHIHAQKWPLFTADIVTSCWYLLPTRKMMSMPKLLWAVTFNKFRKNMNRSPKSKIEN